MNRVRHSFATVLSTLASLFFISLSAIAADLPALRINEIMANNNGAILDEDGANSDWIEIFNPGIETVNLEGWRLTDDSADPAKWKFPSLYLQGGGYLLVFASGKDRTKLGSPLHANFQLTSDGEYLALIDPNGTIVSEFAPQYPPVRGGCSYGFPSQPSILIGEKVDAKYWVPQDGSLGTQWMNPSFDDSSWPSAKTGIGFTPPPLGFTVLTVFSKTNLTDINKAFTVLNDESQQTKQTINQTGVVNYLHGGDSGHFGGDQPFPGVAAEESINNIIVLAYGTAIIPQTGIWTFGVRSDSQCAVYTEDGGMLGGNARRTMDFLWTVNLEAGNTLVQVVYYKREGTAELELFAAPGVYQKFDPNAFRLIGDVKNGGLSMVSSGVDIQSDIGSEMKGKNASMYLRIPFQIDDPDVERALKLTVAFNDGFVAYLNGNEVARYNAPESVEWNSSAASDMPSTMGNSSVAIPIPKAQRYLVQGTNLLAIQALNGSVEDEDFLIHPVLESAVFQDGTPMYLSEPTPGNANGGGVPGFALEPVCSPMRGFYDEPFSVVLSATGENARIRYTTDGSVPTETNGLDYTAPIDVRTTTTLRAVAFQPDLGPSAPVTHTYIFLKDVIHQTAPAGYPKQWNGQKADYEMDPDVVNDSRYADTILDDLKSIPSISIVTSKEALFDSSTGIYANPENKGDAWERPTSAEWIDPSGKEEFQIDCGIQMQGGYSRMADRLKHSFRLMFKRQYGSSTLKYPLFENSAVDEFDTLNLRGNYNDSWHHYESRNVGERNFIRDEYSRRSQLATGELSSHGRFVHLYLNGLYWGLYNICERPDDAFAASYFGGEKEEYDFITSATLGNYNIQVKGGNKEAWDAMMALANQGGFKDNARYEAIQQYLDIDNLIDYMLLIFYTGNRDAPTMIGGGGTPWNFYSTRKREPGAGFRFFAWDSEWTLEDPKINTTALHDGYDNPAFIFNKLIENPEFSIRLADRAHKHFFNGGAFTPEAATSRFIELADSMQRAVVGESARWGDKLVAKPKTLDDNWLPEKERLLTQFFPGRTETVLDQMRQNKRKLLYPLLDAPEFNQPGGSFPPGFELIVSIPSLNNASAVVYYTTDGSDPRLPGGAVNAGSVQEYAKAIPLTNSVYVKARAYSNGTWSAITEAPFIALDAQNRLALLRQYLTISEIHYNPADDAKLEFVELHNSSADQALDISGLAFTTGIEYTFKEGSVLPADGYLALGRFEDQNDKNAFAAYFKISDNGSLVGPYTGKLDNGGERIAINYPLIAGQTGDRANWELVEEIDYNNNSPWPPEADGTGMSLQRISYAVSGSDPSNWAAASPTPGYTNNGITEVRGWMLFE